MHWRITIACLAHQSKGYLGPASYARIPELSRDKGVVHQKWATVSPMDQERIPPPPPAEKNKGGLSLSCSLCVYGPANWLQERGRTCPPEPSMEENRWCLSWRGNQLICSLVILLHSIIIFPLSHIAGSCSPVQAEYFTSPKEGGFSNPPKP